MKLLITIIVSCLVLSACAPTNYIAPVSTAWRSTANNPQGSYIVRRGDTLYAVAWHYEMDYRELAAINHLRPPYHLNVGQRLAIKAKPHQRKIVKKTKSYKRKAVVARKNLPVKRSKSRPKLSNKSRTPIKSKQYQVNRWYWPASGRLVERFSLAKRNKGIDIAGRRGEAIRATASGRVAYSGNGLPGYGNLLIIKHNDDYLSAYAHNQRLLVKEGQRVTAGQKIAEMGSTGSNKVMLHFEIRKAGKPVDPLHYLPRR